jgi:hypothetical protein
MALNGSFIGTTSSEYIIPTIIWSATQSITENCSYVVAELRYSRTNNYESYGYWTGSITINGTKVPLSVYEESVGESVDNSRHIRITKDSNTLAMKTPAVTVPHNADGTKSITISAAGKISGTALSSTTISSTVTLDRIPRAATLTAAPNFNDEESPAITYSNAAGAAVEYLQACISLDGSLDDIKFRDISKTGSSYTFSLTDAERELLRNATTTANSRTVVFSLATKIGGTWYYSKLYRTLSIINAQPTISPVVRDGNDSTLALTGSGSTMIKGYSDAIYSISPQAYKGAMITGQKIVCGSKSSTAASGTLSGVDSGSFVFSATDSRGNTVTQTLNKTLISYIKLTCNLAAKAPTTDGKAELTISGNYFNGSFGTASNSLIVEYRIKVNDGEFGSWQTATATPNGNKYTAAVNLSGLEYRNTYTFQAMAKDALEIIYSAAQTVRTLPVFDWGFNDFNFNVPVSFEGVPLADFVLEQGKNDVWTWRKWSSGICECWGFYYGSGVNASANNYNGFYYSNTISVPLPFTFANAPCVHVNGGSTSNLNFVRTFGYYSDKVSFIVCGHTDTATNASIIVDIYAIGKWK